jgi:hypothetical protein
MALIRSKLGSLAAAIGIGVAAEGLLFVGGLIISSPFRDPWGERIFALTQEPAYHLAGWLAEIQHPGFEEQVGYVILVPLFSGSFGARLHSGCSPAGCVRQQLELER